MKYFTIEELCASVVAKNRGIDNTPSQLIVNNLTELIESLLDPLREAWGSPIVINSGYRCLRLNKAVGSKSTSAHLLGYAADMHPVKGTNLEFLRFTHKWLESNDIAFDQLINEFPDKAGNPSWIHIGLKNRFDKQRRQFITIK